MGGTMGEMTLTPCSFIALLKVLSLIWVIRMVSTFASARRAACSFLGRMGVLLQRTLRWWDFGNRRALLVRPHSDRTRAPQVGWVQWDKPLLQGASLHNFVGPQWAGVPTDQ